MGRVQTQYCCQNCGQSTPKWLGRCPGCGEWNTLVEEVRGVGRRARAARSLTPPAGVSLPLPDIAFDVESRQPFAWSELDRVLGGGLVPGSLVLLGGDPGVGKSTLLLQAGARFAERWGPVLYVTGEESPQQIRMRAERLQVLTPQVWVLAETDVEAILREIERRRPRLVIVDSIQTLTCEELESGPGTVSQVREAAHRLQKVAKSTGIPTILVGHVTKEGSLAGPKVLEHAVDAVLYIEGERHTAFRVLRSVKNRFGSTEEIGLFCMRAGGLEEVLDPSQALLAERPVHAPGSAVFAAMEGSRPLLVEVQALATPTPYGGTPRRQVAGVDRDRAAIVLAVLERRLGVPLHAHDVYINVPGGVKLREPAADLAIALSLVSSVRDVPLHGDTVVFGEVGLAGEVRGVSDAERRINEAAKLGFTRAIIPADHAKALAGVRGLAVQGVSTLQEAIPYALATGELEVTPDARRASARR